MTSGSSYMQRCLELAELGRANVAPNPMVGAVLVYQDRIIGEGYHQEFGKAHAEVNCIASVADADRELISKAAMYVSLEPCAHFGKTPPCADLIIKHKIPKVVVGCRDPFKQVDGKGIEKMKAAGIEVAVGILEKECRELNKRFFTFHTKQRPYIILKWAQTSDGKIGALSSLCPVAKPAPRGETYEGSNKKMFVNDRLHISNEYSNRLAHKWRSEEAAILVGTNTALMDNPELTTRLWPGQSPLRLVLDMNLRLPSYLKLFNREVQTIVFNSICEKGENGLQYFLLNKEFNIIQQLMVALYKLNIQSVLVEGGAKLLQSFIDEGIWDEVRVITNQQLKLNREGENSNGLAAPSLKNAMPGKIMKLHGDLVEIFKPGEN